MSDGNLQHLLRPRARLGPMTFACALAALGCHGDIVTLGEKPPPTYHFGPPRLIGELATSSGRNNNATFTADLLEIFFSSSRDQDNIDVWSASRTSRLEPFGAPQKVRGINSSRTDTGSAISADGLTLWLGSDRRTMGSNPSGNLDIWVSTRASRTSDWSDPVLVPQLNSLQFDIPRPPGAFGLTMPLGSERGAGSVYRSFFATRASESSPFETPQVVPELVFENATTMDTFLSMDALAVFYASEPISANNDSSMPAGADAASPSDSGVASDAAGAGDGGAPRTSADLFVGERAKEIDPFARLRSIDELNTIFEERDPWMSEDKTQFFFSSDRGGNMNIYTSDVIFK